MMTSTKRQISGLAFSRSFLNKYVVGVVFVHSFTTLLECIRIILIQKISKLRLVGFLRSHPNIISSFPLSLSHSSRIEALSTRRRKACPRGSSAGRTTPGSKDRGWLPGPGTGMSTWWYSRWGLFFGHEGWNWTSFQSTWRGRKAQDRSSQSRLQGCIHGPQQTLWTQKAWLQLENVSVTSIGNPDTRSSKASHVPRRSMCGSNWQKTLNSTSPYKTSCQQNKAFLQMHWASSEGRQRIPRTALKLLGG